jgi:hypothetical protein
MHAETIPLRFAGGGTIARIRELTGRDEYFVMGADTANAIDLLTNLLLSPSQNELPLRAADLVASDRDRLLAAVYKRTFGDRIEATLNCFRCDQPFDLNFSLDRVIESIKPNEQPGEWTALTNGEIQTSSGVKFRLPTGNDELAALGMKAGEVESLLLSRCVEGIALAGDRGAFEELLQQIAPLIDLELVASCPECRHVHKVQFDIQTYLLGALVTERRRLLSDINCIASAYSWSLDEVLSLSRSDRRLLVDLIENERVA